MNKFEINEKFLQQSVLKYDPANLILESIIFNIKKNTKKEDEQCEGLIEGDISNLISYLKALFQSVPKEELHKNPVYESIFWVFFHLQDKWLLWEDEINEFSKLIWINEIPTSKRWIIKIRDKIKFYSDFYLTEGNNQKSIIQDKAVFYCCISNYQKAISLQQDAINSYNWNYVDYALLWDFYSAAENYQEAIKSYLKASYLHPDNQRELDVDKWIYSHKWLNKYPFKMWNAYYNIWEYDSALRSFLKCEDAYRVWINMFWDLWGKLCKESKYNLAKEAFKKNLEIDSTDKNAYSWLWMCYYQMDKCEEALVYFKEALSLDENYEQWYMNLHANYIKIWDFHSAQKVLRKLIEKFPGNPKHKEMLDINFQRIKKQEWEKQLFWSNFMIWHGKFTWFFQ